MILPIYLTKLEKILSLLTFLVLLVTIGMCLAISFMLPKHWGDDNYYVINSINTEALRGVCKCPNNTVRLRLSSDDCRPYSLPKRKPKYEIVLKSSPCESIQNYPYVVSLNKPAYVDDDSLRRYACAGIILSKYWILTGQDCVDEKDEIEKLKVRAGSSYWCKGGREYNVTGYAMFTKNGLIGIRVNQPIKFHSLISPVTVPKTANYTRWNSAVSVNWSKESDKKFQKFSVHRWTTIHCGKLGCTTGEVVAKVSSVCRKQVIGNPLVTDTRLLVAVQFEVCKNVEGGDKYIFKDVQTKMYKEWFQFLFSKTNEPSVDKIGDDVGNIPMLKIYKVNDCVVTATSNNNNGHDSLKMHRFSLQTMKIDNEMEMETETPAEVDIDDGKIKEESNTQAPDELGIFKQISDTAEYEKLYKKVNLEPLVQKQKPFGKPEIDIFGENQYDDYKELADNFEIDSSTVNLVEIDRYAKRLSLYDTDILEADTSEFRVGKVKNDRSVSFALTTYAYKSTDKKFSNTERNNIATSHELSDKKISEFSNVNDKLMSVDEKLDPTAVGDKIRNDNAENLILAKFDKSNAFSSSHKEITSFIDMNVRVTNLDDIIYQYSAGESGKEILTPREMSGERLHDKSTTEKYFSIIEKVSPAEVQINTANFNGEVKD